MDRRVRIPVRVVQPSEYQRVPSAPLPDPISADPGQLNAQPPVATWPQVEELAESSSSAEVVQPGIGAEVENQDELEEWRDRALRLQADMDNYRKRQQRLAQDRIEAERQRLLGAFLRVVDDLERALAAPVTDPAGLRQGVELTHRASLQLLRKEGVERIEAEGRPFDPHWHEAVATVGRNGGNVAPETVVKVAEQGYRLGDQLLRPAKVVVAV